MNTKTRKIITFAALLMFCLFSLEQSASAQNNCMHIRGNAVLAFDPVTAVASGTVRNGGFLNGTLSEVVNSSSCCVVTPDPNVVTLLSDLTFTTNHGLLKTSVVISASQVAPFAFTEFGHINPNTSTGRFAGATGVIFITGKSLGDINGPYEYEITGEVCFAP